MDSHILAEHLLKMPNQKITVSVDVSTCDEDANDRAFASELHEIQDDSYMGEITLCFINGVVDHS